MAARRPTPISFDATAQQVKAALLSGLGVSVLTAVQVDPGLTQTTVCSKTASAEKFKVTFDASPMFTGDVPMMQKDVTLLGGMKRVEIAEDTQGNAKLSGTFELAYEGERTAAISAAATHTEVQARLQDLKGIESGAVEVSRSATPDPRRRRV